MQENTRRGKDEKQEQGPDPEREIDAALQKFQLQTGLSAGSPILSFVRLAMKASAPAGQPRPNRRPTAPPPAEGWAERPAAESYKPITPTSSSWVLLIMVAAALLGLLFAWLARTGALN